MPMQDAGDSWDERLVFIVRCNTLKITRSDGVTPATGIFPGVFLDELSSVDAESRYIFSPFSFMAGAASMAFTVFAY